MSNLNTAIAVAIIGGVVTIIAAFIGNFQNIATIIDHSPSPMITSPFIDHPTREYVAAALPVSPTDSPDQIFGVQATPVQISTESPVLPAGADWARGCISTIWQVFPNDLKPLSSSECYIEPVAGTFTAQDGRLKLFVNKIVPSSETAGIFVEVPPDSTVNLSIHLKTIENGELWLGVFGEPGMDGDGLLVIVPEGDVQKAAFAAYDMPEDTRFYLSSKFANSSANYHVRFNIWPSDAAAIFEKYSPTIPVSIHSSRKFLFLGYQASFGKRNRIEAEFYDLSITPR